jgi:hypothetical protein
MTFWIEWFVSEENVAEAIRKVVDTPCAKSPFRTLGGAIREISASSPTS